MMTANNVTTISPRLPHLILATKRIDDVLAWYSNALDMTLVHRTDSVDGNQKNEQPVRAAWLTNDATGHRMLLLERLDSATDTNDEDMAEAWPQKPQHFVFIYRHLNELLDTYTRLKEQGVLPTLCTDAIEKTALYYEDPDNNSVELKVDHHKTDQHPDEHLQRPLAMVKEWTGRHVSPDQLVFVHDVGVALASVGGRIPS
jgi:catechol 2,3-dioxygenase